jgi:hypothetical protein
MKKLKICSIVFCILSIPTFIYAFVAFHQNTFIRFFGRELFILLYYQSSLFETNKSLVLLLWSLLSIPIGNGLIIIYILKKQWLISALILIATLMNGFLIFNMLTYNPNDYI